MPGLDTNILIRWLVEDDDRQLARVQSLFESARDSGSALFVPTTVALELEWVLRSRYGFGRREILAAFNGLLETRELEFQDETGLEWALHRYRSGKAEFAHCCHAGGCRAANRTPLLTFDARAARLPDVELLARK